MSSAYKAEYKPAGAPRGTTLWFYENVNMAIKALQVAYTPLSDIGQRLTAGNYPLVPPPSDSHDRGRQIVAAKETAKQLHRQLKALQSNIGDDLIRTGDYPTPNPDGGTEQ